MQHVDVLPSLKSPSFLCQCRGHHLDEQWIKDYYASSAFNVCEHQALQATSGPLLRIRGKEGAGPVALHQPVALHHPIPLPDHRRQDVLEGLERDCKLGVPAGTPTLVYILQGSASRRVRKKFRLRRKMKDC